jgi:hypothetical protein
MAIGAHGPRRCDGHHGFAVLQGSGGSFAGHAIQRGLGSMGAAGLSLRALVRAGYDAVLNREPREEFQ